MVLCLCIEEIHGKLFFHSPFGNIMDIFDVADRVFCEYKYRGYNSLRCMLGCGAVKCKNKETRGYIKVPCYYPNSDNIVIMDLNLFLPKVDLKSVVKTPGEVSLRHVIPHDLVECTPITLTALSFDEILYTCPFTGVNMHNNCCLLPNYNCFVAVSEKNKILTSICRNEADKYKTKYIGKHITGNSLPELTSNDVGNYLENPFDENIIIQINCLPKPTIKSVSHNESISEIIDVWYVPCDLPKIGYVTKYISVGKYIYKEYLKNITIISPFDKKMLSATIDKTVIFDTWHLYYNKIADAKRELGYSSLTTDIGDDYCQLTISCQTVCHGNFKSMYAIQSNINGCNFTSCRFTNCYFQAATFLECTFIKCSFEDCYFYRACVTDCHITSCKDIECMTDQALLTNTIIDG
jgi:hypothetical protein